MNYQKLLLATLGGGVTMYLLGWIIWGMALSGIQEANSVQYEGLRMEQPNMLYLILAMLVTAFVYAYIFDKWAGIKTFVTGAKAGALLSALIGLGQGLLMMSMLNLFNETVLVTDLVGNIVWGGVAGGVIGWILGRGED